MEKGESNSFSIYEVPREVFIIEPPSNFQLDKLESNKKEKHPSKASVKYGDSPRQVLRHITEKYDMAHFIY
jgi:hypothetical protein